MKQAILVVDDDLDILSAIWRSLSREGYEVTMAESTQQARGKLDSLEPHLIILDIMMPNEDGLTFCKELRHNSGTAMTPILLLSSLAQTDDVVRGLDSGADDYLTKPFELKELHARVRAALRRSPNNKPSTDHLMATKDLTLDKNTFQVHTSSRKNVQLTTTEFRLLAHLMSDVEKTHTPYDLLDAVWQYPPGSGDPDLVRAHIRNLRAKIEEDPSNPLLIQTIHGIGYRVRS